MLPPLCNPTIIRVTKSIKTPKTHENKVGQTLCQSCIITLPNYNTKKTTTSKIEATTNNLIGEILNHSFTLGKSNKFFSCFLEFKFLSRWVSQKQTLHWKWAKISLNKKEKNSSLCKDLPFIFFFPFFLNCCGFQMVLLFCWNRNFPFSFSKDVLVQHLVAEIVVK